MALNVNKHAFNLTVQCCCSHSGHNGYYNMHIGYTVNTSVDILLSVRCLHTSLLYCGTEWNCPNLLYKHSGCVCACLSKIPGGKPDCKLSIYFPVKSKQQSSHHSFLTPHQASILVATLCYTGISESPLPISSCVLMSFTYLHKCLHWFTILCFLCSFTNHILYKHLGSIRRI